MYLNPHEQKVIEAFLKYSCSHHNEKFVQFTNPYSNQILTLKWQDGGWIRARFLEILEDLTDELDDDDPNFEEFWSFWFEVEEVHGTPPVTVCNGSLLINYHNFPDEILHNGVKVN